MAGIQERKWFNNLYRPPRTPVEDAYDMYGSAARKQDMDYSDIMGRYRGLFDSFGSGGGSGGGGTSFDLNATIPAYQSTKDYQNAFQRLSDLSTSGGFSDEDLASIRERAISPVRSVYGNASRNLDRQRTLQGGYSPNYAAASAKMARGMSSQISDASIAANADIAQKVAANKLASAGPLAQLAAGEQENRNQFSLKSADMMNSLNALKMQKEMEMFEFPIKSKLSALGGMTGLYGTTPAVSNMMGNRALDTVKTQDSLANNKLKRKVQARTLFG